MRSGPQFVSRAIKNLERSYGSSIDYYQSLAKTTDLATGTQTCLYNSFHMGRILLLPFKITRNFLYDTAYLAAGNGDAKNISFGAFHDKDESSFVARACEMKGMVPKLDDHISWHSLRFDVKDVQPFPDIQIYVISVVRTQSCKDFYFRTTQAVRFGGTAS